MRKLLLLICVVFLLVGLAGCGTTQLTIANRSSWGTDSMQWAGYDFGPISVGVTRTLEVNPGSDYVYVLALGAWFRTVQAVSVSQGNHASFTLTDSTYMHALSPTATQSADTPPVQLKDLLTGLE